MMEQLHPKTILAKKHSAKRIGSLNACLALGACDVGTATLEDGNQVYITWGRNLNREQQNFFLSETDFAPIWISADDGSAELILPDPMARELLSIINQRRA